MEKFCPNCYFVFRPHVVGAYCDECWKAFGKADGSFEARKNKFKAEAIL